MNFCDSCLAELLTGEIEIDTKLRKAFELGLRQGRVADRKGIQRSSEIDTTKKLLAKLMHVQQIDLPAAMMLLEIPRKDRTTYTKLFANKQRQQEIRNRK